MSNAPNGLGDAHTRKMVTPSPWLAQGELPRVDHARFVAAMAEQKTKISADATDDDSIDYIEPLAIDPQDVTKTLIGGVMIEQVSPRIAINTKNARLISHESL